MALFLVPPGLAPTGGVPDPLRLHIAVLRVVPCSPHTSLKESGGTPLDLTAGYALWVTGSSRQTDPARAVLASLGSCAPEPAGNGELTVVWLSANRHGPQDAEELVSDGHL